MSFPDQLQYLVRSDEPLGPLVWLGIGGPARYFAEPTDLSELQSLYQAATENEVAVRILGAGSNVLVREAGFDGLVISLSAASISQLEIEGSSLIAGGGAKLSHAVVRSVGAGLAGIEHLVGIPGSVGAAVVGNVSAGGRDIGSVVSKVQVLDANLGTREIDADEIQFGHRKSGLAGLVVDRVTFDLEPCDSVELTKRMQKLWIGRNAYRPIEQRRMAMPFVDPDGITARELIHSVGLSGLREGDVSLDLQQPHYLITQAGATSEQCLRLIERVREQVSLQTGIDLQLNLQIW
jgi:UDP-N-acetylmuramate dehydrogenase